MSSLWRPGKSKTLERSKATDEEPEMASKGRSRSKTVLNSLKGKLWKRNRASTLSVAYPTTSKSSTLPSSRHRPRDEDEDSSVVKFEIPMNGNTPTRAFHYSTEDLCAPDGQDLTRKHSSDSSDSGVDTIAGSMPSCCVVETHNSDGITLCAQYDGKSVANAFGPMKDVGRLFVYQIEHEIGTRPPCPLPPAIKPVYEDDSSDKDSDEKDDTTRVGDEKVYDTVSPSSQSPRGLSLGLRDLAQHGWYWGPITRQEAEEILCGQTDGTFLVRDSSNDRYLLSVSFRSQGRTLHTRIEYGNGNFSFFGFPEAESDSFGSVVELINCSVQRSQNNSVFCFSRARTYHSVAIPVRLSIPMSRFMSVQSLQHRCRFVIRQHTRFDLIRELPLPKLLHNYLQQSHY